MGLMDWLKTGSGSPMQPTTGFFKGANPRANPGTLGAFLQSAGAYASGGNGAVITDRFLQQQELRRREAEQKAQEAAQKKEAAGMLSQILGMQNQVPVTPMAAPTEAQDLAADTMTALGKTVAPTTTPEWEKIRSGIFAGESGGDYDALYGYSNRPGGQFANTKLTDMTVDEALQFSDPSGPYGQWVKGQVGRVATPMGAYQIVGSTLRDAKAGLGLTGNEKMTPQLQERLGQYIYQTQGTGAWEGYRGPQSGGQLSPERAAQILQSPNVPAAAKELVMQQFMPQQPERVKGVEINGRLVDPYTGREIADFSGDPAKPSAAVQRIQRLEALGIPNDVATKIADGVYKTITDPVTKEMQVMDLATGQIVQTVSAPEAQVETSAPETPQPLQTPIPGGAEKAFGLGGIVKGAINTAADAIGAGEAFPEVAEHQRYFRVLEEDLLVDLSQAYGRMPAARLMERLRKLGPQAGTLEGAQDAQGELNALEQRFQTDLDTAIKSSKRRMSPSDRAKVEQRIAGLQAALGRIKGAQARFGTPAEGANTTSSGVTWSIVD